MLIFCSVLALRWTTHIHPFLSRVGGDRAPSTTAYIDPLRAQKLLLFARCTAPNQLGVAHSALKTLLPPLGPATGWRPAHTFTTVQYPATVSAH